MSLSLPDDADHFKLLKSLSLSDEEVACYARLILQGAATAPQLVEDLAFSRSSVYRVLKALGQKGFVKRSQAGLNPKYYRAAYLEDALRGYAAYQRRLVQPLLDGQEVEWLRARLEVLEASSVARQS